MPSVYLVFCYSDKCSPDDTVVNHSGKTAGKVRSVQNSYGLGLLRLAETLSLDKPLKVETTSAETVEVTTHIPSWWNADTDEILKSILKPASKL